MPRPCQSSNIPENVRDPSGYFRSHDLGSTMIPHASSSSTPRQERGFQRATTQHWLWIQPEKRDYRNVGIQRISPLKGTFRQADSSGPTILCCPFNLIMGDRRGRLRTIAPPSNHAGPRRTRHSNDIASWGRRSRNSGRLDGAIPRTTGAIRRGPSSSFTP